MEVNLEEGELWTRDYSDRQREKGREVQRDPTTQYENVPAKPRKRSISCRSFPRVDPSATNLTYTICSPAHDFPYPALTPYP